MNNEDNKYKLYNFKAETPNDVQEVIFYKLNEDGSSEKGTTIEEMLRVSIERLTDLGKKFPSRESSIAITKLQESLMWLNERTRDRIERGVEGKHVL